MILITVATTVLELHNKMPSCDSWKIEIYVYKYTVLFHFFSLVVFTTDDNDSLMHLLYKIPKAF